jgi:hypothetical protein
MNEHWFEFLANERCQSLRQEAAKHHQLSSLLKSRDTPFVRLANLRYFVQRVFRFKRNSSRGRG